MQVVVLTIQEDRPVEQAEGLGAGNIQDSNSVKSLTFWSAFLLVQGNSHMKSTVLNMFPPMLQSPLLTQPA